MNILTKTKALEITNDGIKVERGDDQAILPADTVILALGSKSDNALYEAVKDKHPNVILFGDASSPAKAYDATHQAMVEALKI